MNTKTMAENRASPARSSVLQVPRVSGRQVTNVRLKFLIHDVLTMRDSLFDQSVRPFCVTRPQWRVIAFLSRKDGLTQTQLAHQLNVGKAALGNLINRLENGGWVERGAVISDRRLKQVYLTPKAYNLASDIRALEHSNNMRMLKGFNRSEMRALARLLVRLQQNLIARYQHQSG